MNKKLFLFSLIFTQLNALEYEVQFENEQVHVAKVLIEPKEEVGLHRDALPQIVIGLTGGTVTRLESDGSEVDVEFPAGKAVYRPVDPEGVLHRTVNKSDKPIEIMVIQMKENNS